jgi:sulfoxide reductase heme-binding subunit YedZ
MEHFMGEWNIRFLVLTLAVTPVMKDDRLGVADPYRRIFGLLAFLYIFLHLSIYFVLDVEAEPRVAGGGRGGAALHHVRHGGLPAARAAGDHVYQGWIKRLGNKRWNQLHWLIFPAFAWG